MHVPCVMRYVFSFKKINSPLGLDIEHSLCATLDLFVDVGSSPGKRCKQANKRFSSSHFRLRFPSSFFGRYYDADYVYAVSYFLLPSNVGALFQLVLAPLPQARLGGEPCTSYTSQVYTFGVPVCLCYLCTYCCRL